MKKTILILAALALGPTWAPAARADTTPPTSVMDQFSVALLGHMETIIETTTRGKTNAEILATPIQIGKVDGGYLAGLDGGVVGNVRPTSVGQAGYNWSVGIHAHLSPFIHKLVKPSTGYEALAALEVNPRISYLFPNHTNQVNGGVEFGLGLGWSWAGTPQQ